MALQPIVVERFGGLKLIGGFGYPRPVTDPGAVGFDSAVDMLNTDIAADMSQVSTRDGTKSLSAGLAGQAQAISYAKFGLTLAAGRVGGTGNVTLDNAWSPAGAVAIGSWAVGGSIVSSLQIATLGTPTSTLSFVALGGTTLRKYDGTTLAASVGKPAFVGVTAVSNRLVQARFAAASDSPTGSNGTPSTVFFSDPGLPETFGANNYVHLHPGDGESITGVAVFRELLFVFKETKAFVFYGESTDSTGQPVFNYRTISLPNPVDRGFVGPRLVAGSRAIYYIARDGVYRTAGSLPERVSGPVDGYFNNAFRVRYAIGAFTERIAITGDPINTVPGVFESNRSTLVFDERNEQWLRWELPHTFYAPMTAGYNPGTFLYATDSTLCVSDTGLATDLGAAMKSRYRTGFNDIGSPNQKVMRELLVDGAGNVNAGVAYDFGSPPAGTPLVLGAAPAGSLYPPNIAQDRSRTAVRGRNFSVQFDATSGAWSVDRFTLNIRSQRPVGVS